MIGFLAVDKPRGLTSHDVVARARRGTGIKRIGHAGTLDPMAVGVLVLCLDEGTRLAEYLTAHNKEYVATVRFGVETDTYDADGQIIATTDASALMREAVEVALSAFRGDIAQVPPMYSAIKQGGVRLYALARAGEEVERAPRPVTIYTLDLLDWTPPDATIRVVCTVGTYIRSLAHDLGAALNVGAHLIALRRTRSGEIGDPVNWETLLEAFQAGTWRQYVFDETLPLRDLPLITIDDAAIGRLRHGQVIQAPDDQSLPETSPIRMYDSARRLVAIGERRGERIQPVKVFHLDTDQ
ncbi:MAG: tRNA pseudouridine(55) synthase TruB [Aggregatilineales bacterium]